MNGKPLSLKQTSRLERWRTVASLALMKLQSLPPPVSIGTVLLLLVLVLSLTACATPSTPSSEPAKNPTMPQPSQSQPSELYLLTVQKKLSEWQTKLKGMLETVSPTN